MKTGLMRRHSIRFQSFLGLIVTVFVISASFTGATAVAENAARPDPLDDPDLFCVLMIYVTLEEVGKKCFSGKDPALQREISSSLQRIEAYVDANSSARPARRELKAERTLYLKEIRDELRRDGVCQPDMIQLYEGARREGVTEMRANIDDLLSPGHKTEGTCI